MASRKEYLALARALEAAYPHHLAPRSQGGQWHPGVFSIEDLLALPGVAQAVQDSGRLAPMLAVISEFSPHAWFCGFSPGGDGPPRVVAFNPPPYWVPGRTFVLYPPNDYRPSLLVETHVELGDSEVTEAKRHMASIGSQSGLLFDAQRTLVLRDSLQDDPLVGIEVAHQLRTSDVLARFAPVTRASLDADVERWLQKLTASWTEAIPERSERNVLEALLEDVAPAAQGAKIYQTPLAA